MNINTTIDLKTIVIFFFTIYMLTSNLYIALFNSLLLHLFILIGILIMLIFSELITKTIYYVKFIDLFIIIASFTILFNVLSNQYQSLGDIVRPLSLVLVIFISLLIRVNIDKYYPSLKLIKWAALIISISVLISYLTPNLYSKLFLNHLNYNYINAIIQAMREGYHTGFTAQVAYTAGYIIQGIGVIFCIWLVRGNKTSKVDIILFLVMILGLLLTQKRAHLLFLILSMILVYLQFSDMSIEKVKKVFKVFISTVLSIFFFLLLIAMGIGETFFSRIIDTYQNFLEGNDITSNRWPLWLHAIELFKDNPIFGIGWGKFSETVIGSVTIKTQMETHNVYLQLLSETGIVGFLLILGPMIITYIYTVRVTKNISKNKENYSEKWIVALLYSLFTQTFFLLYGITGNPLYDFSYFTIYFIAIGIIYSFKKHEKFKDKRI